MIIKYNLIKYKIKFKYLVFIFCKIIKYTFYNIIAQSIVYKSKILIFFDQARLTCFYSSLFISNLSNKIVFLSNDSTDF